MSFEKFIKKKLKELKERFPSLEERRIERELVPLTGEEVAIRTKKKKE